MGLFQHKQAKDDPNGPLHFFDDYFREELRKRGREYFEKVIDDNATLFKKDLDATISKVNADLHNHITERLDTTLNQLTTKISEQINEQFVEYGKAMKDAEDAALRSLGTRAQALEGQFQQLSEKLEKSVAEQEATITKVFDENMSRVGSMQNAQAAALQSLSNSVEAMEKQYHQIEEVIQKKVAAQQEVMVNMFEQNMAQIIEHYLLEALGDQYDLKAQLPSIIKQMESNKQAIVDDMKL